MDVADIIAPDLIVLNIAGTSKQRVLLELSRRAAADLHLEPGQVFEAMMARENLGSTGVGMGTAIPHARITGLKAPYGLVARLTRPVDFESVDGAPVDLICFFLLPTDNDKENLALLAGVAKRLRAPDFRVSLRGAQTRDECYRALVGWKPAASGKPA